MKITSPKLHTSYLTANDEAVDRCRRALELKDKGSYRRVQEVMSPLWERVGERPRLKGLHPSVAAEVLMCVGILTRWIGSKNQFKEGQEFGKDLISESITYYQSSGDVKMVAAGQVELACCYWREGSLNEARIMLGEALPKLTTEGNTRARAFLALAVVEWSSSRYHEALRILAETQSLFEKITNDAIKGAYYNQLAVVLEEIAAAEKRDDYFQQAIRHYQEADRYFKLAHNTPYRADVKNNLGFLLSKLSRFDQARTYIEEARRLAVSLRDKRAVAQIDQTRAQVFIDEGKYKEAEAAARSAVSGLEKTGHQCLLADALITHGVALARLHKEERALFAFQKAIEVSQQVEALNKAGLAALSMIEEIPSLQCGTLHAEYLRARQWLKESQSKDVLLRLNEAANKVVASLGGELNAEEVNEVLLTQPCNLKQAMLDCERSLIRQALARVDGSVTHAASLLGLSHQGLGYIIDARHKDLIKERSPVHRRPRKGR
ncbi:MAG TPA: tetratricopeptide repeat protein [Pyrinomonadaceae bacterium]|jgi:tetratricopeptide (TPR) repeat protein|nr:tetratricopeptide repeat protein [Pyrinomonadaceae bacterium]